MNRVVVVCCYSVQLRPGLGSGLLDRGSHSVQGATDARDQCYCWSSYWSSRRKHHSSR